MARLMGFKKTDSVPASRSGGKGNSIYKPLIDEVARTGSIYSLDVHDAKRARSLCSTIYIAAKRAGMQDAVKVVMRGTTVYVSPR